QEGRAGHARDEARPAQVRPFRQEGEEPQAGHRHRPQRSPACGRQGPGEEAVGIARFVEAQEVVGLPPPYAPPNPDPDPAPVGVPNPPSDPHVPAPHPNPDPAPLPSPSPAPDPAPSPSPSPSPHPGIY